jgi:hypothetical protein
MIDGGGILGRVGDARVARGCRAEVGRPVGIEVWGVKEGVRSRAGRIEGPLDRTLAPLVADRIAVVVSAGLHESP